VAAYVRQKGIALAREIKNRKKVYLDTRYWVMLREARLGRSKNRNDCAILNRLETLVKSQQAVCPLNADIWFELRKHKDPAILTASAQLIDDLSLGVCLLPIDQRLRLEIRHFLDVLSQKSDAVSAIDESVWTTSAYSFGFCTPNFIALSREDNIAAQKAFADHMWTLRLADRLKLEGADVVATRETPFKDISRQLNDGKFSHLEDHASFTSLFLTEVRGIIDAYQSDLSWIMQDVYEQKTGAFLTDAERVNDKSSQRIADLICQRFQTDEAGSEFPTIRVSAGLHAAMRWDKMRRFKPHDTFDFRHAEAALPYCDLFFTERSLCSLVKNDNLDFRKYFNCLTFHDPVDALNALG
jgi:hypothetical protein